MLPPPPPPGTPQPSSPKSECRSDDSEEDRSFPSPVQRVDSVGFPNPLGSGVQPRPFGSVVSPDDPQSFLQPSQQKSAMMEGARHGKKI